MQAHERDLFLSSRDRHPPNEAAMFVETHVAFPGQPFPVFSEQASGFVSLEEASRLQEKSLAMWKEVDEEKERLFDLMQQVQTKLQQPSDNADGHVGATGNLRQCNWREVLGEVQRTALRWKNRPSKQGKIMVFIDKMGRNSSALESWLQLLPMGDYGSSICGVFKLAVRAAGQYSKVEETIFEALSEIPRIMESAGRYVTRYQQMRDQFLEQRTFELFKAILTMLRHVLQFFADSKPKKFMGSVLKQDQYKDDLQKSLGEIKSRAQAVNEEAMQCQGRMLSEVHSNTESLNRSFQQWMQFLLASPFFKSSNDSELRDPQARTSRPEISGYDWVHADHMVSSDEDERKGLRTMPWKELRSPSDRQASRMAARRAEAEQAREKLLQLLHYDPDSVPRDISSCLRLGYQLSDREKARAAAMIKDGMFRDFMEEAEFSTCLLVNGRGDLASSDGVSPLGVVIAELARTSEAAGILPASAFVVKYFCAAHQSSPIIDPSAVKHASAISMMASLIGQLLLQLADKGIIADLSFLTDGKWKSVERLRPKVLCTIFRNLVGQMPPGSVLLCLVDEISLYESQMLRHQTDLVMEKLVRLAMARRGGDGGGQQQVFKLLVTCQDRALGVARYFSGHTLDLQEDIEADDSADWTISTMAV